jgi:hypothetical protein
MKSGRKKQGEEITRTAGPSTPRETATRSGRDDGNAGDDSNARDDGSAWDDGNARDDGTLEKVSRVS